MMLEETQELVQNAEKKEYLSFKEKAIEMLKQKTAEKLAEMGYFSRLDNAKGIFEDEDEDKDNDKDDKDNDKDDKDSKDKDDKDED